MEYRYCFIVALLITALSVSVSCFSQTKVYAYDYDESGNRIERQFIQLKSASIASDNNNTEQEIFEGTLDQRKIKIYPNPTAGNLKVEIPLNEEPKWATLQVYNLQGALIHDQLVTGETTLVNLNGQPSGMYIMRIFSGQSVSEWKIMKE
jgi:hypothetical protein